MCHFITAVLPSKAPHAELDIIARKHGRQFLPLSNPSIERQLRSDQKYFLTTVGHCDCGTALGFECRKERNATNWAAEEQRLSKRGWSKAKVARALAQKREGAAGSGAAQEQRTAAEIASWTDLIEESLAADRTSEISLLLHFYGGTLDEDILLQEVEAVSDGSMTAEALRKMREDVLLLFRR